MGRRCRRDRDGEDGNEMFNLAPQEQLILVILVSVLFVGTLVKEWRARTQKLLPTPVSGVESQDG